MAEVTAADKVAALIQLFQNPQLYIGVGILLLIMALSARMKSQGARAGSMVGRLGLVIHWASLLLALATFLVGAFILATAVPLNENQKLVVGLLWASSLLVWLIGRALRFVLTGPLSAPAKTPIPQDQYYREQVRHLPSKPSGLSLLPAATNRPPPMPPKVIAAAASTQVDGQQSVRNLVGEVTLTLILALIATLRFGHEVWDWLVVHIPWLGG
jgi:hypothetical protein